MRLATDADVEAITECVKQAYSLYVDRIGRQPAPMTADYGQSVKRGCTYVLEAHGDLLGVVVMYANGDHWFVETIAVSKQFQGAGFGAQIMGEAESVGRAAGFDTIELYTNEKMTENFPFYASLGYAITEYRQEAGFRRVYFRKRTVTARDPTIPGAE